MEIQQNVQFLNDLSDFFGIFAQNTQSQSNHEKALGKSDNSL